MRLEHQLKVDFERIAKNEAVDDLQKDGTMGKGCDVQWTLDAPSEAIKFDADCIRCVEESAKDLLGDQYEALTQSMISGAGHDSVFTSKRVPTSMIFRAWMVCHITQPSTVPPKTAPTVPKS